LVGEPLSPELATRIVNAPINQLRLFEEYYHEFTSWNLAPPDLPPGHLRPSVWFTLADAVAGRPWKEPPLDVAGFPWGKPPISVALKLLLYAHEVLLDDPLSKLQFGDRGALRDSVEMLLRLKPLADLGAVHLRQIYSRARHPASRWSPQLSEHMLDIARAQFELLLAQTTEFGIDSVEDVAWAVTSDVCGSLGIARGWPGKVQPLVRSRAESMVLQVMFELTAMEMPDLRSIHLQKLASMTIPTLEIEVNDLVAVRRNSEDFAKWRTALSTALAQVQQIEEGDETWAGQASAIVNAELDAVREQVQAEVRRSPARASLRSGTAGFALAGLGALVGSTVGSTRVLPALVGAGSARLSRRQRTMSGDACSAKARDIVRAVGQRPRSGNHRAAASVSRP
jgi:hypothetical protein